MENAKFSISNETFWVIFKHCGPYENGFLLLFKSLPVKKNNNYQTENGTEKVADAPNNKHSTPASPIRHLGTSIKFVSIEEEGLVSMSVGKRPTYT